MFTFGRDHEKACAVRHLRNPRQSQLIEAVIDGAHDLLEGRIAEDDLRPILSRAFTEGGSGVWEGTASWLRKLIREYPHLRSLWSKLANHAEWRVRFRAACCIRDMPAPLAKQIAILLRYDRSRKVCEMAAA